MRVKGEDVRGLDALVNDTICVRLGQRAADLRYGLLTIRPAGESVTATACS